MDYTLSVMLSYLKDLVDFRTKETNERNHEIETILSLGDENFHEKKIATIWINDRSEITPSVKKSNLRGVYEYQSDYERKSKTNLIQVHGGSILKDYYESQVKENVRGNSTDVKDEKDEVHHANEQAMVQVKSLMRCNC